MQTANRILLALLAVSVLSIASATAFTVDPPSQNRSNLLRLRGPSFGATQGTVAIAGLSAPIAHWDDSLIECYVPEGAPLGKATVVVRPPRKSHIQPLKARMTVLAREIVGGRVKWRLKLADQYVPARPMVGPDGTIYAMGNFGHVYAANPDGSLRWVVSPVGGVSGAMGILPNGNLIVGGGGCVQALSPVDGSTLWTFSIVTPLVAGPSVGPDGNIYAADDSRWSQDVIGAFILSPEGQLLSSGGKYYRRGGGWTPQEVKFGGGNAYFWSDYSSTGDPDVLGGLNALHLGGGLFWRVEDGVGILPDSNPNGDVVLFRPSNIEMHNASNATIWSKVSQHFWCSTARGSGPRFRWPDLLHHHDREASCHLSHRRDSLFKTHRRNRLEPHRAARCESYRAAISAKFRHSCADPRLRQGGQSPLVTGTADRIRRDHRVLQPDGICFHRKYSLSDGGLNLELRRALYLYALDARSTSCPESPRDHKIVAQREPKA